MNQLLFKHMTISNNSWQKEEQVILYFSSPDCNVCHDVEGILRETGLDPQYLELEITESAAMKGKKYIIETLNIFKKLSIHIAIDDFGTEYSSLNYLKQLPVDRIKIQ
ncbi:MAG TPA: EAL domain-containing protein [Desulfosporosinus sp.]|nr:EAL domain-containing protein [Desulfosporosinus sp.]